MDSPSRTGRTIFRALQVERTPQGSLSLTNDELLVERTGSGRLRPWRPQNIEVGEGIEVIETPQPRRLFSDEADNNPEDDIFDAQLAEELAVDSGSELDEEELTEQQLRDILEEPDDLSDHETENIGDPEISGQFDWSQDYNCFTGRQENFEEDVGPKIEGTVPVDIFTQIWDEPLIQKIVEQTNLYAWQTIAQVSENGITANSRLNDWVETSVLEIYRLIAIIILMGICLRGRIEEYWCTGVLGMPGFRTLMSRDRYLLLMKFIHFVDNYDIVERGTDRKIAKIIPIVQYLNRKFQSAYSPRRELSLDESLLLWKGRLSWVQCIRTKAARFGIKSYELCEAVSGYVLKLIIYTGKNTTPSQPISGFSSSTAKIVLRLLKSYLGKGYTVVMDNFYNSVELCRYLKSRATDVIGTLNRRRQATPTDIKVLDERRLPRGTIVSRHCGDISVTAWKDVKLVTTVSTYHDCETTQGRRAGQILTKPKIVEDYNKFMGGVDLKDQKLSMYLLERKRGTKWYIKVFKRLLNICILNSYIIYCANIGQRKKMTHRQFRIALATGLLQNFNLPDIHPRTTYNVNTSQRLDRSLDHFPEQTTCEGDRINTKQNKYKRSRCVRCLAAKKRTMTSISCSQCKVFLCVGQCWREYHTIEIL